MPNQSVEEGSLEWQSQIDKRKSGQLNPIIRINGSVVNQAGNHGTIRPDRWAAEGSAKETKLWAAHLSGLP